MDAMMHAWLSAITINTLNSKRYFGLSCEIFWSFVRILVTDYWLHFWTIFLIPVKVDESITVCYFLKIVVILHPFCWWQCFWFSISHAYLVKFLVKCKFVSSVFLWIVEPKFIKFGMSIVVMLSLVVNHFYDRIRIVLLLKFPNSFRIANLLWVLFLRCVSFISWNRENCTIFILSAYVVKMWHRGPKPVACHFCFFYLIIFYTALASKYFL